MPSSFFALIFGVLFSFHFAKADVEKAPAAFTYKNGKAIFVNFLKADYRVVYDKSQTFANVESEIEFEASESGFPIFDLIPTPVKMSLNGQDVSSAEVQDPDMASKFRVVDTVVEKGRHTLKITSELRHRVSVEAVGIASAFWTSDLDNRMFLEQYLPTNFEFDAYSIRLKVKINGFDDVPHVIKTNGQIETLGQHDFLITYPPHYTASSVYFHLFPDNTVPTVKFDYASIDGRMIPVEIYTRQPMDAFVKETKKVLAELEADYGPYPHDFCIVYGAGAGGMEYSGATMTSLSALGHELFHFYNARAVMPNSGNSGWIDEALSSWRDVGYRFRAMPNNATNLAGHSQYRRTTHMNSYSLGRDFMSWLAYEFNQRGKDFKAFLKEFFQKKYFTRITTEEFRAEVESYVQADFKSAFDKHVYGRGSLAPVQNSIDQEARHLQEKYHPRLSEEELNRRLRP